MTDSCFPDPLAGETGKVYDSYQALAKYFEESSDYKTAVYFYEKCWEISNLYL